MIQVQVQNSSNMLLGAWPIGGAKHTNIQSSSYGNGKCRFIILCGGYILFLIFGAAIISVIEAPTIEKEQHDLWAAKEKFLEQNPCIQSKLVHIYYYFD